MFFEQFLRNIQNKGIGQVREKFPYLIHFVKILAFPNLDLPLYIFRLYETWKSLFSQNNTQLEQNLMLFGLSQNVDFHQFLNEVSMSILTGGTLPLRLGSTQKIN